MKKQYADGIYFIVDDGIRKPRFVVFIDGKEWHTYLYEYKDAIRLVNAGRWSNCNFSFKDYDNPYLYIPMCLISNKGEPI